MAEQTYVEELAAHVGQEVTVKGWLHHKREKGKLVFLLVRDGTGVVQAVAFRGEVSEEDFEVARRIGHESSLVVRGTVRQDARAPGGYELSVRGLRVFQEVHDYPITPKEHGVDFLMQHRHLWLRSSRQHAALRIRATLVSAARQYLDSLGFLCLDTPILTPAAVEGTTTLFPVDYFGETAYLAQSGQLYSEAAIGAFGRVYCFGPTFRAEKSKTRRHLLEFWMLEPEMAWAGLEEAMELAEGLVCHLVSTALEHRRAELEVLERDVSRLEAATRRPYPRIPYDRAVELIGERGEEIRWGDDFGTPQETAISTAFDQPVFVHHYPTAVKAFYMEVEEDRPEVCRSVDLIAPEGYGEIIGGGERTARLDFLEERIAEHGLPRRAYDWYLDLRRYGAVPHSGFGLGLERTVAWICGLDHVREAIPFPRLLYRLYP